MSGKVLPFHQYHSQKLISLRKEKDSIKDKINRLLDLHLERVINKEEYHGKKEDLEKQLAKVKTEQELHENADGGFKDAVVTAFNLASKASELFKISKTTEKRELIAFVFSNLSLRGAKLEYTLRQPFDMMMNVSHRKEWLCGGTFSNFFSKWSGALKRKALGLGRLFRDFATEQAKTPFRTFSPSSSRRKKYHQKQYKAQYFYLGFFVFSCVSSIIV